MISMNNEELKEQINQRKYLAEREAASLNDSIDDQVRAFKRGLLEKHREEIDRIRAVIRKAEDELTAMEDAERDAAAEKLSQHSLVGKRVSKISRTRFGNHRKIEKRGVIQVFQRGDEIPENAVYGIPQVGTLVIRILKADGTPGKHVVRLYVTSLESAQLPVGWEVDNEQAASV